MTLEEKLVTPQTKFANETDTRKYRLKGESFRDKVNRNASALSDSPDHFYKLRDILRNQYFLPAGRIQSAAGSPQKTTAFNCFVSNDIEDSMEGIMDAAKEAAQTMRLGGGIGYDFSSLRPRDAIITTLGSKASGAVSFMQIFDAVCSTVSSAGDRRGAQMGVLRCDHPDIEEFIAAKQNSNNLTNFNISVGITDAFMRAVQNKEMFPLVFKGVTYKLVDAAVLWESIMRSTWDWAEPGVLFIDRINQMNNLQYCELIGATNPCVTGDTLVGTPKGLIPVSGIKEGQIINTVMGDYPVTRVETHKNVPVFLVKFSDGSEIKATAAHIFHVQKGKKFDTETRLDQLTIGDRVRIAPMVRTPSGTKDDWNLGFLVGTAIGDGCMTEKSKQLRISCRKDEPKWIQVLQSTLSFAGNVTVTSSTAECSTVNSTDGLKLLDSMGLARGKSFEKAITLDMLNKSTEFLRGYIDGMLSTDGNVHISSSTPVIRVTSTNKENMMMLKRALSAFGICVQIYQVDKSNRVIKGRAIKRNYQTYTLVILGTGLKDLYTKIGITRPSRKTRLENLQKFYSFTGCTWSTEIRSITPIGVETVYDLFEQVTDTWITDGIVNRGCGEQPLPGYGACLLGSHNLTKYIGKEGINYDLLKEHIPSTVRALDNIIDTTIYPLEGQRIAATTKRRMGIGYTGMANCIEYYGFPYGSPEYLKVAEKLFKVLRDEAYRASIELAKEKGAFALFDRDKFCGSNYIKTLPVDIQEGIYKHGIRNSHLISFAPTGTISITADNVSSSIEPVFSLGYTRTVLVDGLETTERVQDYGYRVFGVKGKTANECTVDEHLSVLALATKYSDSAVSKTINVGDDVTWDQFKAIYRNAFELGCKGCTTFRAAGKRYGILNEEKENPESNSAGACYIDTETGQKSCS